jgi:hypothetical protein
MTVAEYIAYLSKLPQDAIVVGPQDCCAAEFCTADPPVLIRAFPSPAGEGIWAYTAYGRFFGRDKATMVVRVGD